MVKRTTKDYIERAIEVHDGRYDYSKTAYHNARTKVIIGCEIHGYFSQNPNHHLQGSGCPECLFASRRLDVNDFVLRASKVHNDKYTYNLSSYKSKNDNVLIYCQDHGEFLQNGHNHLSGAGCPSCGLKERKGLYNTKTIERFREKYLREDCWVYVFRLCDLGDDIYKIGISSKLPQRKSNISKNCGEILEVTKYRTKTYFAFYIEQHLINLLEEFKYSSLKRFPGYTELFKLDNDSLNLILDYFKTVKIDGRRDREIGKQQ